MPLEQNEMPAIIGIAVIAILAALLLLGVEGRKMRRERRMRRVRLLPMRYRLPMARYSLRPSKCPRDRQAAAPL